MRKRLISAAIFAFLVFTPLLAAVKQVRVTADRASIHIEPNRNSTRIEIVERGMLLNLLQQRKIKDTWYYVTFSSPRYGTKISGFIMDSVVELVGEQVQPQAKVEEPPPTKPQPAPPQEKPAPEKPLPPKIIKEVPVEPKPAPVPEVALTITALPKAKSFRLPRKEAQPQEMDWKPLVIAAEKEEKKAPEIVEVPIFTPLPKAKSYRLPRREKPREELAWKPVIPPVEEIIAEKPSPAPVVPQEKPPQPPEVKKEELKIKEAKKEKEAQVIPPPKPPVSPATPKPVRREPVPRKRGSITFGFGYGSSVGGAGGFLQVNTKAGLSFHAGLGYYPTTIIYSETDWVKNEILYSAGIKYYLPFKSPSFSPYLDLQYGGLRIEAAQIVINIETIPYVLSSEQKVLYGPSLLAGSELQWRRVGLNAAAGVSYNTTKWDILKQNLFFAFDLSLVIHF